MDLWRLCRRPHADLTGEGARLFGGRWNSPGRPVVYFADHPALATLEVRVHLDLPFDLLPNDYVLMHVTLPDRIITHPRLAAPPANTVEIGNAWLEKARHAALRVPSVLTPNAWNILLDPRHPDAAHARIVAIESYRFDPRLWEPLGGEG
jgi:RES domain-containing protein